MSHFDMNQICTRLIPQISLLLLDKSRDVHEVRKKYINSYLFHGLSDALYILFFLAGSESFRNMHSECEKTL